MAMKDIILKLRLNLVTNYMNFTMIYHFLTELFQVGKLVTNNI